MITILTGNNASGKTKFLRKKYNEVKDKKVLVNFDVYQNNKKYNIEDATVDEINWRVDFLQVRVVENEIRLEDNNSKSEDLRSLVDMITRDIDYLILDEPESGLTRKEEGWLLELMYCIPSKMSVFVSTHSDMICSGFTDSLFVIQNDELKKVDYEDTDCI